MSLIVRAIVRIGDAGRAGSDLVAIRSGDIAVLASRVDGRVAADERELRAHHAIAAQVHDAGPSLPSRFGQVFADEAAVASAVAARRDALVESLERVGDRVEMSVTLTWRATHTRADTPEPRSGREFLVSRAAREHERQDARRAVARLVSELAAERALVRHSICPREGVAAIVAVLIDRDDVRELRERVVAFGAHDASVAATVHGPMPPYSFAS
jgi:hypothetical protein